MTITITITITIIISISISISIGSTCTPSSEAVFLSTTCADTEDEE